MAGPEQFPPGEEPTNHQENQIPKYSEKSNPARRASDRPRRRSNEPFKDTLPFNPDWFEPSDFLKEDVEADYTHRPRRNSKRNDNQDLDPDTDFDTLRADIYRHPERYESYGTATPEEIFQLGDPEKLFSERDYHITKARVSRDKEKDELEQNRTWFKFKMFLAYSSSIMFMIFVSVFIALFLWATVKDGLLNENGIGSAILTVFETIFRIIFENPS